MLGDMAAQEGTRADSLGSFPFGKTVNFVCLFVCFETEQSLVWTFLVFLA